MTIPAKPPAKPAKLSSRRQAVEALREFNVMGPDLERMRESVFRDFLTRLYDPATDRFDIALWIATFHTQQRPVAITDDADQLIYICPPLTGTVQTMFGGQIGRDAKQAEMLDRRHGQLGENQRVKTLAGVAEQLVELNPREVWRKILERYGIIKVGAENAAGLGTPGDLQDAFLTLDDE